MLRTTNTNASLAERKLSSTISLPRSTPMYFMIHRPDLPVIFFAIPKNLLFNSHFINHRWANNLLSNFLCVQSIKCWFSETRISIDFPLLSPFLRQTWMFNIKYFPNKFIWFCSVNINYFTVGAYLFFFLDFFERLFLSEQRGCLKNFHLIPRHNCLLI